MQQKVLQVVGGMNRGGAETWLMHVLRHIDRQRFQVDFLVHTAEPAAFDDEIRALGSRVMPCLSPGNPLEYRRNFRRMVRGYHAIHSHVHHFSGYVLWLAQRAGIPVRIAHSHLDTRAIDQAASLRRRAYLGVMKGLINYSATQGLAASDQAAPPLFGEHWQQHPRWQKFYCAIDLAPFEATPPQGLRQQLGIPPEALVIGHVGRFFDAKNHAFIPLVAQEVLKKLPQARFLLVGEGPLRPAIEQQVASLGLSESFIFAGLRADIPALMKEAMDIFLLPSLYEGLPLVAIEAQAAGLPIVLADTITPEVNIVPARVVFKSLSQAPQEWATALVALHDPLRDRATALSLVKASPFNIQHSIKRLEQFYLG